jgi:hypothetical protein
MVTAIREGGFDVIGSDITQGVDFLRQTLPPRVDAIVSNPPYALAREFIERALSLMHPRGVVAMLLRTDYDHAASRRHLFAECPAFAKKLVLTRRIRWFDPPARPASITPGTYGTGATAAPRRWPTRRSRALWTQCVVAAVGSISFAVMSTQDNTLHVRLLPEDRRSLDELQSRFSASGFNVTTSDLVRAAIARLPMDPAALFRNSTENRPR